MKKTLKTAIYTIFVILSLFVIATEFFGVTFSCDEMINSFISDTVMRVLSGICVMLLITALSFGTLSFKRITAKWLLVLPCLLVIINNFPFFDWLSQKPEIINGRYLPYFLAECLAVGFFEELLFRGFIFPFCLEKWNGSKKEVVKAMVVSSAVFGLFHLTNLFSEPFGAVIMQVGYSFLLGMLMCFVMMYTENVWLCVIMHAGFNFAGLFATTLTAGVATGVTTWIITAVIAVIVAVYAILVFAKVDDDFSGRFMRRKK